MLLFLILSEFKKTRKLVRKQFKELRQIMEQRLDRLDAATNKLAQTLQELRETAVNGMTPEQVQRFDATIAALEALGSDPENPVPEQ